jgi:trehalose utilization protein
MAAGRPGAKMFPFENPRSIILDSLTDDHLTANVHQIEHAPDRVACGSVSFFFFASADPRQRVQGRRFGGPKKVKLDDPFQVLVRLLVSAHGVEKPKVRQEGFKQGVFHSLSAFFLPSFASLAEPWFESFMNKIRVLVWGENVHEQRSEAIRKVYPEGIHQCIADGLSVEGSFEVGTATLQDPEHGLPETRLSTTDVLIWWGHIAHAEVADEIVERAQKRVLEGMGLLVLHSGHYSKLFKRLMGTTCSLIWREAGEKERLWVCNPGHPIAQGIKTYFEIPHEEMYGEPFGVPAPEETVFISWFEGGEVFRSGCCWKRGNGKIFYFRPGHESFPTYRLPEVQTVIRNAVHWVAPEGSRWIDSIPNVRLSPEGIRQE